jgi:hypothetical protein
MSPAKNVQLSRAMRALGRQFVHLPPGQEKNLAGPPYSKEMLRPWHAELHTCKVAKLMELCSNLLSKSNLSLSIALPRRFKYISIYNTGLLHDVFASASLNFRRTTS